MGLKRITAPEAIARLADFDAVIDARSESEYAEDRLPLAVNWPSLNDAERIAVGTQYKQVSPFEARKQGAVLVAARNIAHHVEAHLMHKPREWRPLVYCWRGRAAFRRTGHGAGPDRLFRERARRRLSRVQARRDR